MTPELAGLIAEGVIEGLKIAAGAFTKEDVLTIIEQAMKAASDAEMRREFPGQAP